MSGRVCLTNLKFPHQERDKGSVDAALDDKDNVGEFVGVRGPQMFSCTTKVKHSELYASKDDVTIFLLNSLYEQQFGSDGVFTS